jgi:hypothetical protein
LRKLLFIWLCFAGYMAEGEETGRAVLVGTNVVSLGVYPGTEERTVRVEIKNDGKSELKIEGVVLTCDCLRVEGYPQRVVAGKTGEVLVTVKKNELSGSFRRVFYVRTNDPEHRLVTVAIEGNATPLGFRIVPDQVILRASEASAERQFLMVLDGSQTPDAARLIWHSSLAGVTFHPVLSKGGNGFLVEVVFSAEAVVQFMKNNEGVLTVQYDGGPVLTIPISIE